jgi:glycosyltransferase involved in cell wall biosynthesis
MRILILNWRDIRNPRAGGAERVTHEVAKRLIERGHRIEWLTAGSEGLPATEEIDGITVVRRGSEITTRFHARAVSREFKPDVILEEINTLPYFAPLWSPAPVVLYMNQLARDVWWYEAPLPLAAVGWATEPLYLQAYRSCECITISRSSRDDLRRFGLGRRTTIAPMAVDAPPVEELTPKLREGHLVAIGRLTPSKRYDHALQALALLRRTHPAATLTLIGEGRDYRRLLECARHLGVEKATSFLGRVTEEAKLAVLDRCDVLIGTSVREGWGLTVTEAAARGTPSVVYDIPGFRDAVVDGRTGLTVAPEPSALARAVGDLLDDHVRYDAMRAAAWRSVAGVTYDATTDAFEGTLLAAESARG